MSSVWLTFAPYGCVDFYSGFLRHLRQQTQHLAHFPLRFLSYTAITLGIITKVSAQFTNTIVEAWIPNAFIGTSGERALAAKATDVVLDVTAIALAAFLNV